MAEQQFKNLDNLLSNCHLKGRVHTVIEYDSEKREIVCHGHQISPEHLLGKLSTDLPPQIPINSDIRYQRNGFEVDERGIKVVNGNEFGIQDREVYVALVGLMIKNPETYHYTIKFAEKCI